MPANPDPPAPRPICPKCHLPIRSGEKEISYEGHFYHIGCAPPPGSGGDKDDPYRGETPIAI